MAYSASASPPTLRLAIQPLRPVICAPLGPPSGSDCASATIFFRYHLCLRRILLVKLVKLLLQPLQLLVGELFQVHELIPSPSDGADEFIKLQVDRLGIAI